MQDLVPVMEEALSPLIPKHEVLSYQFYLYNNIRHELSFSKRKSIFLMLSSPSSPVHLWDAKSGFPGPKKKRGNKECVCMHECVYTVEGGRERKQSNKFSCRKTSDMTPQKASQGQLSPAWCPSDSCPSTVPTWRALRAWKLSNPFLLSLWPESGGRLHGHQARSLAKNL